MAGAINVEVDKTTDTDDPYHNLCDKGFMSKCVNSSRAIMLYNAFTLVF